MSKLSPCLATSELHVGLAGRAPGPLLHAYLKGLPASLQGLRTGQTNPRERAVSQSNIILLT